MIYLVSSVERIMSYGLQFVYTDRHPLSAVANWYEDPSLIAQVIDWSVMHSRYWHDTVRHPNRKSLRQAEFLVYDSVPIELIAWIGVYNLSLLSWVQALFSETDYNPIISMQPDWYY